jgi:hypothetical protein
MVGGSTASITAGSAEWILLSVIYHYVLAQSPSPEAAKIAIYTARRDGRLRFRAEVREHKPIPGRLNPGEQPAKIPPKSEPDQPILAIDEFSKWDWERSYATRRDTTTKFLFEYVNIVGNRDDVLRLWPRAEPNVDIPKVVLIQPEDVTGLVWAVVVTLDNMEKTAQTGLAGLSRKQLTERVGKELERKVSLRTLDKALEHRRKRKKSP